MMFIWFVVMCILSHRALASYLNREMKGEGERKRGGERKREERSRGTEICSQREMTLVVSTYRSTDPCF